MSIIKKITSDSIWESRTSKILVSLSELYLIGRLVFLPNMMPLLNHKEAYTQKSKIRPISVKYDPDSEILDQDKAIRQMISEFSKKHSDMEINTKKDSLTSAAPLELMVETEKETLTSARPSLEENPIYIEHKDIIEDICERFGLPPEIPVGIISIESSNRSNVISHKDAYGLTQMTELAWKEIQRIHNLVNKRVINATATPVEKDIYSKMIDSRLDITSPFDDIKFDSEKNLRAGMLNLYVELEYFRQMRLKKCNPHMVVSATSAPYIQNYEVGLSEDNINLSDEERGFNPLKMALLSYCYGKTGMKKRLEQSGPMTEQRKDVEHYLSRINRYIPELEEFHQDKASKQQERAFLQPRDETEYAPVIEIRNMPTIGVK